MIQSAMKTPQTVRFGEFNGNFGTGWDYLTGNSRIPSVNGSVFVKMVFIYAHNPPPPGIINNHPLTKC